MEAITLKSLSLISLLQMALVLLNVGVSGAQVKTTGLDFQRIDPRLSDYGFVSRDHLWPDSTVEVCWENATAETKVARLVAEEAVEQSWPRFAHLNFTGWSETCSPSRKGVHILIVDEASAPRSLIGNRLDGRRSGVRLNLTFQHWGGTYCAQHVQSCIRTIAIHEFGHVLGLIHESLRQDAPKWCKDSAAVQQDLDSDPGDGVDELTPYDPESIMNYCNRIYGRQQTLSDLDKRVARIMYPTPEVPY
jgi:hypothetical protein